MAKTIREKIENQIRLQETVQREANINIVNCGNCGSVFLHERIPIEVLIREIEPEITYYLFGDDAVREFNNNGLEGLLNDVDEFDTRYSLFALLKLVVFFFS